MSLSLCSLGAWEGEEPGFHKRSYKPSKFLCYGIQDQVEEEHMTLVLSWMEL
jgi:hypothetical protein